MKLDSFDDNIGISYFDPFSLFDNVKNEFLKLFPLTNVRWKSQNNLIRTRLVENLPIDIYSEDKNNNIDANDSANPIQNQPLLKLIIVTCQSVDEYRAKIRPLLREWSFNELNQVESVTKLPFKPLILFYSNSKVIESNLFTSINILEKIKKDFPTSEVLDLKSVYKSPNDKQIFWTHLQDSIKKYLLDIFERRLTFLNGSLSKLTNDNINSVNGDDSNSSISSNKSQQLYQKLRLREQILILYVQFKLKDECQRQIDTIKMELNSFIENTTEYGNLEYPFSFNISLPLSDLLKTNKLTKFDCYKHFLIWDLKCYSMDNSFSPIRRIYHSTKQFLRNSQLLFPDNANLIQFKYSIIDTLLMRFFQLPSSSHASSIVDKNVIECRADLLLMKRDCWLEGILTMTNFKMLYKQYSNTNKINFDIIGQDVLDDENKFHENFIRFNQELIGLYNQCDSRRQRIVDILSLEIGMVYYQRGDYENAIILFLSCYEYYIQSNWKVIGLQILKMFVDSIEKCGENNIKSLEFNGSKVSLDVILSHSYLNLLKLSDDPKERIILWKKFIKLGGSQLGTTATTTTTVAAASNNNNNNDTIEKVYSMDGIIGFDVDEYVTMEQPNLYSMKLYLTDFSIPETVTIDSIELTLHKRISKLNKETVTFQRQNVELGNKMGNNRNVVQLNTKKISFGKFEAFQLKIKVGNKFLLHRYSKQDSKPIYVEPIFDQNSVSIKIEQERCLKLGDNRLNIGFFNLDKVGTFTLKVIVEKDDESVIYPIRFHESDTSDITYLIDSKDDLIVDSSYGHITVPYYLQDSLTTAFFIKTVFQFEKVDRTEKSLKSTEIYQEINHHLIQCYLPVSVSVEDIFKNERFYFKFLLNSSIRKEPVMLYGSELNGVGTVEQVPGEKVTEKDPLLDKYKILGRLRVEEPILLTSSNNDSCVNSYRIMTKGPNKYDPRDTFYLHVRYSTLKEELDNILTNQVLNKEKNRDGNIDKWRIFWEVNILPRLQYNYERYYREGILILENDSINLNFIENDLLRRICMEDEIRSRIVGFLKGLCDAGFKMLECNSREKNKNENTVGQRELIVPVELQSPRPFYLIQFEKDKSSDSNMLPPKETYAVGESIPFKITITDISDQWEESQEEQKEPALYIFEITSSNDWLLHGKKRFAIRRGSTLQAESTSTSSTTSATREAKAVAVTVVNVSLIPLRTGHLNLPGIQMTSQGETQPLKTHQPNENDIVLVL